MISTLSVPGLINSYDLLHIYIIIIIIIIQTFYNAQHIHPKGAQGAYKIIYIHTITYDYIQSKTILRENVFHKMCL